jgi:hypothetical protein
MSDLSGRRPIQTIANREPRPFFFHQDSER